MDIERKPTGTSDVGRSRTPDEPVRFGAVRLRGLVDLAVPGFGLDVSKATDQQVFDAAALRQLHDELDRHDRTRIDRRPR